MAIFGVEARKYDGSNITIQKQKTGIEARTWDLTNLTNKILWFVHQQNWNKCFFTWRFFNYIYIK